MKTVLPERSLHIKGRLNFIVQQILELAQDKIAMIILYGSYARGDWVRDLLNGYHSDTDILIILKKGKYKGHATLNLKDRIYTRLKRKGVIKDQIIPYDSRISIILESIEEVNKQLEKGRYFYTDIKKEGILFYDSSEYVLSEDKDLPWSEMKEIAQDYFEYWFGRGKGFLKGANNYLKDSESFYSAILLVFSNYKPKLHDIEELGSMAKNYNNELLQVFPIAAAEQKECLSC
ncbi:nucleotidyltransferase domain-containing protein [Rickettsia endosymbiont of Pantilius tunicatus]|uniref:nucleotidyltransferase domain-containing protein n=1 Tax=Rickettsia endosymbiont of Pantilius tunicatus TaxID=3066267 RepID=UPI00376ECC2A